MKKLIVLNVTRIPSMGNVGVFRKTLDIHKGCSHHHNAHTVPPAAIFLSDPILSHLF